MTYFVVKGVSANGTETQIKATEDGELEVRAIVETELEHASANGRAYAFRSANTDIDAGDTRLFVKNTSDKFLVFSFVEGNPANVVCDYDFSIGSATTTPTGTVITAQNLNGTVAINESYLAYDDETAVATGDVIKTITVPTTHSITSPLDGIILGKNQYLQVTQITESTSGRITLFGHFEDELV